MTKGGKKNKSPPKGQKRLTGSSPGSFFRPAGVEAELMGGGGLAAGRGGSRPERSTSGGGPGLRVPKTAGGAEMTEVTQQHRGISAEPTRTSTAPRNGAPQRHEGKGADGADRAVCGPCNGWSGSPGCVGGAQAERGPGHMS